MSGPSPVSTAAPPAARPDEGRGESGRRACAVWIWAGLGVFFLVLQGWIWTSFLASGPEQLTRYLSLIHI